jgi:hypothetical protein
MLQYVENGRASRKRFGRDLKQELFNLIYSNKRGLTLTELSKKLVCSHQTLDYNLKMLIEQEVIIKENSKYYLQPILYSEAIRLSIMDIITKYVNAFGVMGDKADPKNLIMYGLEYLVKSLAKYF